MHKRRLPLSYRCPRPVLGPGDHCTRCDRKVHDLSTLTEDAAQAFVARRRGEPTCIRYRSRADGSVVFARPRSSPAPWLGLLSATLLGCAPIVESGDLETPGDACHDEAGFEVLCVDQPAAHYRTIPDTTAQSQPAPPEREARDKPSPTTAESQPPPTSPPTGTVTVYDFEDIGVLATVDEPEPG